MASAVHLQVAADSLLLSGSRQICLASIAEPVHCAVAINTANVAFCGRAAIPVEVLGITREPSAWSSARRSACMNLDSREEGPDGGMASSLPIPGVMSRPVVIVTVAIVMGFFVLSRCHHHPVPSSAAVETAKQAISETSGQIVHREVSYRS